MILTRQTPRTVKPLYNGPLVIHASSALVLHLVARKERNEEIHLAFTREEIESMLKKLDVMQAWVNTYKTGGNND